MVVMRVGNALSLSLRSHRGPKSGWRRRQIPRRGWAHFLVKTTRHATGRAQPLYMYVKMRGPSAYSLLTVSSKPAERMRSSILRSR